MSFARKKFFRRLRECGLTLADLAWECQTSASYLSRLINQPSPENSRVWKDLITALQTADAKLVDLLYATKKKQPANTMQILDQPTAGTLAGVKEEFMADRLVAIAKRGQLTEDTIASMRRTANEKHVVNRLILRAAEDPEVQHVLHTNPLLREVIKQG